MLVCSIVLGCTLAGAEDTSEFESRKDHAAAEKPVEHFQVKKGA